MKALSSLFPIIQLAITPVILISGMGALMLNLTNRMARIVDRTRRVAEAIPGAAGGTRAGEACPGGPGSAGKKLMAGSMKNSLVPAR